MQYTALLLATLFMSFSASAADSCAQILNLETVAKTAFEETPVSDDILDMIEKLKTEEASWRPTVRVKKKHRTRFFLKKDAKGRVVKTKRVIMLSHGLLNSPVDMVFLAEKIHEITGYNVVLRRLPKHGHWWMPTLNSLSVPNLTSNLHDTLDLSEGLGETAILGGHSTGGLKSLIARKIAPETVKGLLLFAPASQVSDASAAQSRMLPWAGDFGSSVIATVGNMLLTTVAYLRKQAGEIDTRFMSPRSGIPVEEFSILLRDINDFSSRITYTDLINSLNELGGENILWIDSTNDTVIKPEVNEAIASQVDGINYIMIPPEADIDHGEVADPSTHPSVSRAPHSQEALREIEQQVFDYFRRLKAKDDAGSEIELGRAG